MPDGFASAMNVPKASLADTISILPLEVRGLVFEVHGQRLIDGIDLRLMPGSRTVIMGPNGAGKSLLLRLLHGLLHPSSGSVRWRGGVSGEEIAHRQAMVFQRPILLRRSAEANILYALAVHGVPRQQRRERAAQALKAARLSHLARSPARVLSVGEQQRLAIVRALSTQPDILFLDEPSASLDPASMLAVEELMERAHQEGTKIVLITHDVGQARRMADDVVFIHRGRLQEHTAAAHFFEHPKSEAAQAFLDGRIVV